MKKYSHNGEIQNSFGNSELRSIIIFPIFTGKLFIFIG
jgi:hypothetical protein